MLHASATASEPFAKSQAIGFASGNATIKMTADMTAIVFNATR